MKKLFIILILLLFIAGIVRPEPLASLGYRASDLSLQAQEKTKTAPVKTPNQTKAIKENPIKEIEILDYDTNSSTYEYSTMTRRARIMELFVQITGVTTYIFLVITIILGLFSRSKALRIIHIIFAFLLFSSASTHLVFNLILRK